MTSNPDYIIVYNTTVFNNIYELAQHRQYSNYKMDNQLTAVWLLAGVRFVFSSKCPDQVWVPEAPSLGVAGEWIWSLTSLWC
jgi:hypothetical protein